MRLVLDGDVAAALDLCKRVCPGMLAPDGPERTVCFRLRVQHFIELLRRSDVLPATAYAQQNLAEFGRSDPALLAQLTVGLAASTRRGGSSD
jgi:hypothetical protein